MRSLYVTPTLFVGDIPEIGGTRADSVEQAVALVKRDERAVLPADAWGMVADVLRAVGCSEEMVEDRIHFAQTGRTLHDV